MQKQKQLVHKILFLGPTKCGKTSFLQCYDKKKKVENQKYIPTIGVDFHIKKLMINQKPVKLQMWDTSGSQKYGQLNKTYYKLSSVFVCMFDLSDLESFENLKKIIQYPEFTDYMELNIKNQRSPLMMLIGSKSDLQQKVPDHLIEQISEYFALYSKVSSKTGQNVQNAIEQMAQKLIDQVPYIWNPYFQNLIKNKKLQQQNAAPGQVQYNKEPKSNNQNQKCIKILLVGPAKAGKTSLLNSYFNGTFQKDEKSTIGVQFKIMYCLHQTTTIKIYFYDSAGQERFRAIPKAYYKGVSCVYIVYDCTNEKDFKDLSKFIKQFQQCKEGNCYVCLVGTKCDLVNEKKVTTQMGMEFAAQNNLDFTQLSAINDPQNKDLSNLFKKGVDWVFKNT